MSRYWVRDSRGNSDKGLLIQQSQVSEKVDQKTFETALADYRELKYEFFPFCSSALG
jgi:hypothetical protein